MKIIAHRGDSQNCIENTITAFEAAINAGADMIETDVRLTKDGVPVIFHDDDLMRLAAQRGSVEKSDLARLNAISLHLNGKGDETIPTLDETIAAVDRRCSVILEIKEHHNIEALCKAVEKRIRNDLDWIEVSCFNDAVLETMRALNGNVRLHKLIDSERALTIPHFDQRYPFIYCFDIDVGLRDRPAVKSLIEKKKVVFWTVAEEDIADSISLGLFGAMSNDPQRLREKYL